MHMQIGSQVLGVIVRVAASTLGQTESVLRGGLVGSPRRSRQVERQVRPGGQGVDPAGERIRAEPGRCLPGIHEQRPGTGSGRDRLPVRALEHGVGQPTTGHHILMAGSGSRMCAQIGQGSGPRRDDRGRVPGEAGRDSVECRLDKVRNRRNDATGGLQFDGRDGDRSDHRRVFTQPRKGVINHVLDAVQPPLTSINIRTSWSSSSNHAHGMTRRQANPFGRRVALSGLHDTLMAERRCQAEHPGATRGVGGVQQEFPMVASGAGRGIGNPVPQIQCSLEPSQGLGIGGHVHRCSAGGHRGFQRRRLIAGSRVTSWPSSGRASPARRRPHATCRRPLHRRSAAAARDRARRPSTRPRPARSARPCR